MDGEHVAAVDEEIEKRRDIDRFGDKRCRIGAGAGRRGIISRRGGGVPRGDLGAVQIGDEPVVVPHLQRQGSEAGHVGGGKRDTDITARIDIAHRALDVGADRPAGRTGGQRSGRHGQSARGAHQFEIGGIPGCQRTRCGKELQLIAPASLPHDHFHRMRSRGQVDRPAQMIERAMVAVVDHDGDPVDFDASPIVGVEAENVIAGGRDGDDAGRLDHIRFSASVGQIQVRGIMSVAAAAEQVKLGKDDGGFAGDVGVAGRQGKERLRVGHAGHSAERRGGGHLAHRESGGGQTETDACRAVRPYGVVEGGRCPASAALRAAGNAILRGRSLGEQEGPGEVEPVTFIGIERGKSRGKLLLDGLSIRSNQGQVFAFGIEGKPGVQRLARHLFAWTGSPDHHELSGTEGDGRETPFV